MDACPSSPSVVVGIDGSRSALVAATCAADEALSRDVPLRLVYAIDPEATTEHESQAAAHELVTAEKAVRQAVVAVESTDNPIKIDRANGIRELTGPPSCGALRDSKRSVLICAPQNVL
jgi:nucleotide-binding universal stress UspA family protein